MNNKKFAVSDEIKTMLEKWIARGNKGYLDILPASTGSGKSHAIASIMGKNILSDSPRTMIYLVHTTENLKNQYESVLEQTRLAKDATLLLKEDAEMLIDFFGDGGEVKAFTDFPEYWTLREIARTAKRTKAYEEKYPDRHHPIGYLGLFREAINRSKKDLQNTLRNEYKRISSHTKREEFRHNVAHLFPTANLLHYKAILLTTHKFMYPIWTLTGSTYLYEMKFYPPKTPKEEQRAPILFIDEFDAQKNVLLGKISEEAATSVIDQISFFVHVRNTLKGAIFLRKYGLKQDFIDSLVNQFDSVYETYANGFSFVYQNEEETEQYLIQSRLTSATGNNNEKLTIIRDASRENNIVRNGEDDRFADMLGEIEKSIRLLSSAGKYVVRYQNKILAVKAEDENIYVDWEEEQNKILRQFIGEFNLNPGDASYQFLEWLIRSRLEDKDYALLGLNREDFYSYGLSVIQMEDTDLDAKRSSFGFYNMGRTPESFLVRAGAGMHMIGISATASIDTVIKNFDLHYLRTKLRVHTPHPDKVTQLNHLYIKGKEQTKRTFHVEFIDSDFDLTTDDALMRWFNGDRKAIRMAEGIFRNLKDFHISRYLKYLELYWKFVTTQEIQSFLVLVNAYPKNEGEISIGSLTRLFGAMVMTNINNSEIRAETRSLAVQCSDENCLPEQGELFFIASSTRDSKRDFKKLQDEQLKSGAAAFVISVYQSMGAGRNIQYEVEIEGEVIEKDYDAIYCEKPTNLLVRYPDKSMPVKSLLMLLYQIHALYAGEHSTYREFKNHIEKAITSPTQWFLIKYSDGDDYHNAVMVMIIQAIGRLHRVNSPEDSMYIFLDEDLRGIIRNFDPAGHALLPSVEKILEHTGRSEPQNNLVKTFNAKVKDRSERMDRKIKGLLKYFPRRDKDRIKKWEAMRHHLLVHPTIEDLNTEFADLYTPSHPQGKSTYCYRASEDYAQIDEVSPLAPSKGLIEVSPSGARVDILLKVSELRGLFEQGEIAEDFNHSYMMLPVVFNNLYKGALGEVVGRFIVEKICGIPLEPLDAESGHYEFFDYIVGENPDTAVDFKYFSDGYAQETRIDDLLHGKYGAIAKRTEMKARKAVIINLLYMGSKGEMIDKRVREEDGVFVIPYLIDASDPRHPRLEMEMIKKARRVLL